MRTIKLFLTLVVALLVFQTNVFSTITSRIEGTVLDEVTKEPIEGAWIALFHCDNPFFKGSCRYKSEIKSDRNGKFKFDDLASGPYFVVVVHRSYEVYGPAFELIKFLPGNTLAEIIDIVPRGRDENFSVFPNKPERNFILKEGQIKHLVIKLKRGSKLFFNAWIIKPTGVEKCESEVDFIIKEKGTINHYLGKTLWSDAFRYGSHETRCLPALGETVLFYRTNNFIQQNIALNLQKSQTTKVDLNFDFTKGQVIHGFVLDKETGKGLPNVNIRVSQPKQGGDFIRTRTATNGEFWCGGLKPGKYKIVITTSNNQIKDVIELKQNERMEYTKSI